jgi:hypothetical protein
MPGMGTSRFLPVTWVDANERDGGINLIFGTRIEVSGVVFKLGSRSVNGKTCNFL